MAIFYYILFWHIYKIWLIKYLASNCLYIFLNVTFINFHIKNLAELCLINMVYQHSRQQILDMAGELVSDNQTVLMPGRCIADDTLLADELLHRFGRAKTSK